MELFHFDIETAGQFKNWNEFVENDQRGSKLFKSKYEKLNWSDKYDSIEDAYLDNAGIISTYGRIVCISFGFLDNQNQKKISSFYGEDEFDIVNSFNNLLNKIEKKSFNLCGFRINHFDIPWLLHKCHKYELKPSGLINLYGKKPWDMRIVDMSDDWRQKFAWAFSFDEMCYELGVKSPKQNMNGSEVHTKFWSSDFESIKNYCEEDVSSSIDASLMIY